LSARTPHSVLPLRNSASQAFDDRLIAIDEFHHVSSNPDNKLGSQLSAFMARERVHLVAMTGSYFRGDSEAVLAPDDESKFETVTYTYYEQLNGYQWLKSLDIGYLLLHWPVR
jgi:superfamily II DNA or RNA helicase